MASFVLHNRSFVLSRLQYILLDGGRAYWAPTLQVEAEPEQREVAQDGRFILVRLFLRLGWHEGEFIFGLDCTLPTSLLIPPKS